MYTYEEIQHVHLEITSRCNARCPMCARNARGVTAPNLQLTELSIEDVRAIFPESFWSQIKGFDICGAYGEPAIAQDLIAVVAYARSTNPQCFITIYTNGGVRLPAWWTELARVIGTSGRVIFAIDGLEKTNHIYRRGVDFKRVIANARSFISAGGQARWEYLAFKHNEDDIEEARTLSKELGFSEFSVKKTARFLEPTYDYVPECQDHNDLTRFPIFETDGTLVGHLEPPYDPSLINKTTRHFSELLNHYGSLESLFSTTPIHCRVLDTRSVFVSCQGYVFPCCWTYVQATRPMIYNFPANADYQVYNLVQQFGGFERIDARVVGLQAAVESALFDAIEKSWSCNSVAEGRLRVCARACGTDFPAYFDQFDDVHLQPKGLQVIPLTQVSR